MQKLKGTRVGARFMNQDQNTGVNEYGYAQINASVPQNNDIPQSIQSNDQSGVWANRQGSNFGGRVPYTPKQAQTAEMLQTQPTQNYAYMANGYPMPSQPQTQQGSNVIEFPRSSTKCCTHVWVLRSYEQCGSVIEQLRSDHAFYITMEMMQDEALVLRCKDALAGAAYALGVEFHRISLSLPVFLITSRMVQYDIDPIIIQFIRQQLAGNGAEYAADTWNGYAAQRINPVYPEQSYAAPQMMQQQQQVDFRRRVQLRQHTSPVQQAYSQPAAGRQPEQTVQPMQTRSQQMSPNPDYVPGSNTQRFMANVGQPASASEVVNGYQQME